MTQGELERIPEKAVKLFSDLEIRIMDDIVRRIKINGFSTASADWQITRLQQLGKSEEDIKEWIRLALEASEKEIEKIFSDETYKEYMKHERAYTVNGMQQVDFKDNQKLQSLIFAVQKQTGDTFRNITQSMGFVKRNSSGKLETISLTEFYRNTLDAAIMDIQSGAFDYRTVLKRTINDMTTSGIRFINYGEKRRDRIDVACRRAIMTGFRQVQGKINEQVAEELNTDSYEVTYHVGARPDHQPWQGKVWTMQQMITVCGLGTVEGLHGANCYHDYRAFIPGISIRAYTDEELGRMIDAENKPKRYNGKEYTTYEALQEQRRQERNMRKVRQDIHLLREGGASEEDIMLKRANYHGKMQKYLDFSKEMKLPTKKDRIYQDGLKGQFDISEKQYEKIKKKFADKKQYDTIRSELKALGIRGRLVENHKTINIKDYGFDEKHINAERSHNVTKEEAQQYIREAKIVLERWNGQFLNYYGENGSVYVDVKNKNVRTAYKSDEYDNNTKKIIEVMKKHVKD